MSPGRQYSKGMNVRCSDKHFKLTPAMICLLGGTCVILKEDCIQPSSDFSMPGIFAGIGNNAGRILLSFPEANGRLMTGNSMPGLTRLGVNVNLQMI